MTAATPSTRRSDARANRIRILDAAREELGRNPDASLADIAQAAGLVRRTIYSHFPSRPALIAALADEARQALEAVFSGTPRLDGDPPEALARMVLASWSVADRFGMLVALGRGGLSPDTVETILAPVRAVAIAIIDRGQRAGAFADVLPAEVLSRVTESIALGLLESRFLDDGIDITAEAAATSVLIAAGVTPTKARRYVKTASAG